MARLARATRVLLLVMDALSYADCCELVQDLDKRGWMTLTDQPGQLLPCLLSTVPSVTAMARTSLCSGKLTRGTSAVEKQNFVAHAALLAGEEGWRPYESQIAAEELVFEGPRVNRSWG